MGLLDLLFSSASENNFSTGDFVRIKLTGEEATITIAFNNNTYEVEIHGSNETRYCNADELEKLW